MQSAKSGRFQMFRMLGQEKDESQSTHHFVCLRWHKVYKGKGQLIRRWSGQANRATACNSCRFVCVCVVQWWRWCCGNTRRPMNSFLFLRLAAGTVSSARSSCSKHLFNCLHLANFNFTFCNVQMVPFICFPLIFAKKSNFITEIFHYTLFFFLLPVFLRYTHIFKRLLLIIIFEFLYFSRWFILFSEICSE